MLLTFRALASQERLKFELACLERWGLLVFHPAATEDRPAPLRTHGRAKRELRDGWGSSRGIRPSWIVRLTRMGLRAVEICRPLVS